MQPIQRACFVGLSLCTSLLAGESAPIEVASPNGQVRFVISSGDAQALSYTVTFREHVAIEPSRLGLMLDGEFLGRGVTVGAVTRDVRDDRFPILGGHREAHDHSHGARIALHHTATGTEFFLEVRAFDDGAGFRWLVPAARDARVRVPDAGTDFVLPAHSTVWMHDLAPHYEGIFAAKRLPDANRGRGAPPPAEVAALPAAQAGEWTVVPLVAKLPAGAGYVCITESALASYAGMALQFGGPGLFRERLGHAHPPSYPYVLRYSLDEADRLARPAAIAGPIITPWRVVMVAPDLHGLVNSDIITSLAPPPDPTLFPAGLHEAWIKPGRALWKYLQPGDSTPEAMKEYARLAHELGFEYNVLEGFWNRWSLEERRDVVAFSRSLGVGVWFWHHSRELRTPEARRAFFAMLADLGVAGAKIDFLDHEAQETIALYDAILTEAARHHVLVNFHGANKPTGQSRTWPHELTREAVFGFEHRRVESWSAINTVLPFTRFLAGPADYTPVMFNERRHETSWAHQLATACVFTSPLQTYGARPQDLLANPAVDWIKSLPSVWEETIVLPESAIGELAAFARRSDDAWFIGILNGPAGARTLEIPLRFLDHGAYDLLAFHDVPEDSGALRRDERAVTPSDVLRTTMRAGGGFVARLTLKK